MKQTQDTLTGADPLIQSSMIHLAARDGKMSVLSRLLKQDENPNITAREGDVTGITPLYLAVRFGHIACVNRLLQAGASPSQMDSAGRTALSAAKWNQDTVMLRLLAAAPESASSNPTAGLKHCQAVIDPDTQTLFQVRANPKQQLRILN